MIHAGKGTEPDWNENFVFTISDDVVSELTLKIMDSDAGTGDDLVGEAAADRGADLRDVFRG